MTDRIEGRINLGDGVTRSLKGLGIPEGATVQVSLLRLTRRTNTSLSSQCLQLVVEVVAAGSPKVMSQEAWTYSEDSFRTASYKVYGTVFNPKVERNVRRPPPPPPVAAMQIPIATEETPLLLSEKQAMHDELDEADGYRSRLGAMFCCG